ncbi:WD40-repeat-containing domain protein [Thamnocephalis sphaerospora]|uniref:WD40-repeat-containing domain protein n=1 Tax=Thamnocephalis sphaerospora TaxID=78915 RepID=A0A4P9XRH2_9FUNG|nr:WD40-repeat-containing domain protein [Thamnocephalis sphaerospora]|eukprot:RKP08542.1 WD40-repeat-containing domain protein [Thamnocephalis sphaerospora]
MEFQTNTPVNQRVQKVRWLRPAARSYGQQELYLLAGLSGNNQADKVALYECTSASVQSRGAAPLDFSATAKAVAKHPGDLLDMACIDEATFATATSEGSVHFYNIAKENGRPGSLHHVTTIPTSPAERGSSGPSTCLAVQPNVANAPELAVAGEDGRVTIMRADGACVVDTSATHSMSITGLTWLSSSQILAATSAGQLLLYDRNDLRKPVVLLYNLGLTAVWCSDDDLSTGINTVAVHPSQINKVAAGDQRGRVAVWDLRARQLAFSEFTQAHSAPVWEVRFHPLHSDQLISCSDDNTCCITDWARSHDERFSSLLQHRQRVRPVVHQLSTMSANSIDYSVTGQVLACGSDSGQLLFYFES